MGPSKWGGIENVGDLVGTFPKLVPEFTFAILIFLENTFLAKERVNIGFCISMEFIVFYLEKKIIGQVKL